MAGPFLTLRHPKSSKIEPMQQALAEVRARIERAAERSRRDPASITLLAVTKVFPASVIREAYDLGLREFGENYVQEFETKAPAVADLAGARFHLIGHLQSNKARRAAELFHVIQTVDSAKLARRLDESRPAAGVMLEVNLSPEQAKSGADPAALPDLVAAVRACPNLRLLGLMTMPPWSEDPEASRPYFRRLRELAAATRPGAALHGDVARFRSRHRGRRHLHPRRHRAVRQKGQTRLTVGFFSPLPPAPTGVADYAAALLGGLRVHGNVEIAPARCTVPLYHLGNNALHAAIYRRALEHPGVVVLHDAVLHHFLLGQLAEAAYIEEFVYNYGEWNRGLAAGTVARPRLVLLRSPLLRIPAAPPRRGARPRRGGPQSRRRPHGPRPSRLRPRRAKSRISSPRRPCPPPAEAIRFRQRLGVPPDAFLFGVFGYLRESKRLMAVLDSFAAGPRRLPAPRPAGGRPVRLHAIWSAPPPRSSARPGSSASLIFPNPISGWPPAPSTPASICAIPPPAKPPASPSA